MKPRSSGPPLEFPRLSLHRPAAGTPPLYETAEQLHTRSYDGHTPANVFKLLDGATIRSGDLNYRVTVYSVHNVGHHLWVQLTLNARHDHPLVLDMAPTASVDAAVNAIETYLANPRQAGNVLRVN